MGDAWSARLSLQGPTDHSPSRVGLLLELTRCFISTHKVLDAIIEEDTGAVRGRSLERCDDLDVELLVELDLDPNAHEAALCVALESAELVGPDNGAEVVELHHGAVAELVEQCLGRDGDRGVVVAHHAFEHGGELAAVELFLVLDGLAEAGDLGLEARGGLLVPESVPSNGG